MLGPLALLHSGLLEHEMDLPPGLVAVYSHCVPVSSGVVGAFVV